MNSNSGRKSRNNEDDIGRVAFAGQRRGNAKSLETWIVSPVSFSDQSGGEPISSTINIFGREQAQMTMMLGLREIKIEWGAASI
jgi:hypothetical protein